MRAVQDVHYVDLFGPLDEAACGEPIVISSDGIDLEVATTLFMSSATCPACQDVIQGRLEALSERNKAVLSSPGLGR